MSKLKLKPVELLFDGASGCYIPERFVIELNLERFDGINPKDVEEIKKGQDSEFYWDSWNNIESNATITEDDNTWQLYTGCCGDLFLICLELMTDEEKENFGFEID